MSMSIADMYQEMIDQYTELYMYKKAHGRVRGRSAHEEDLDDFSAAEVILNLRMRPSGRTRDLSNNLHSSVLPLREHLTVS